MWYVVIVSLLPNTCAQISITLDAEELLPVFLRRRIVKPKREIIVKERRGRLRMFREDIWGKEHWNSIACLKKHIQVKEVSGAM